MLLKAIRCQVAADCRAPFARGQRAWSASSRAPGFSGQTGGWAEGDAWVTSWWNNWQEYAQFMREHHDRIYAESGQKESVRHVEVSFWDLLPQGTVDRGHNETPTDAAEYLQIEILELAHGSLPEFEEFMTWRWRPALAGAGGLSMARMCRHRKLPGRYLAWSLWRNRYDAVGVASLLQPGYRLPQRRLQLLQRLEKVEVQSVPEWHLGIKHNNETSSR
jgi:uncharacterized protein DUF4937